MHELYELKEKLMKELGEYAQNGKYSKEDVETIKYMASAIDHMCNIVERADEEGYSQRGYSRNSYTGGGSRGGQGGGSYRYSRRNSRDGSYAMGEGGGSYARGRGSGARRNSMGRYSQAGDPDGIVEQLEDLMQDAPNEQIKQQIQQLVQQLEQM